MPPFIIRLIAAFASGYGPRSSLLPRCWWLLPVLAAWIEVLLVGLPHIPPVPQIYPNNFAGPHGFPLWVRYCHFFNFLFVTMLIRSGLSILADHPRLYFNNHCTPGSEWIRLTPITVPTDRVWTAKDDARYVSPIVATPGYRHTIGLARSWHFLNVYGFIITGILLRHHALRYGAVAAARSPIAAGAAAGLEHMGTLCDVPPAA